MTFFWLSSGVLFISSLVFSILFVGIFLQDRCNLFSNLKDERKLSKTANLLTHFVIAVVLTPFGQTFPVIIWAAETFYPHQDRGGGAATVTTLADGRLELKKPLSDVEIETMIERHGLVGDAATELRDRNLKLRWEQGDQLREYLKAQMMKHAPFVGEAITESVPQSLIQLVALIVIGQMTASEDTGGSVDWLSVLSIILSIISIISKSYIVSISMVRSIFTFKMLAITYDTIALFYIFSSLFLGDASTPGAIEVPFLDRSLDPLSAIWLFSMASITVWLYVVWIIFGIDVAYTDWEKRIKTLRGSGNDDTCAGWCEVTTEHIVMSLGFLAMGTVLWLPLMVVLTACNVSFIVIGLKNIEDPFNEEYFPLYSRVLRLFASGEDIKTKIQAYNCVAIECQYEVAHGGEQRNDFGPATLKAQWLPDQRKLKTNLPTDQTREMMFALNLPTFHLSNFRIANNTSMFSVVNSVAKDIDSQPTTDNHYGAAPGGINNTFHGAVNSTADDSAICSCCYSPECTGRKIRARIFCRQFRILLSQMVFVFTIFFYLLVSLLTLLYPPISFIMILSQRLGTQGASWDGVRTFQTILFCVCVLLLALLIWKALTVLPWYIKCLWHMTPITRGISIITRSLNMPGSDKATVLDHVFRRVVTTYSARSGRPELDVYAEVDEHGEGSGGICTAYCMECMFLIGRAA
mmetsp:Transcript_63763/g.176206  ORF Transcript_63763/g.176206 Transcript_63763/m.176206 type:complete len:692 (-) Transcript_63763:230-2305(-)